MSTGEHEGGCECGNVRLTLRLSQPLGRYEPRACDCDFCQPRGVHYLSDPAGAMRISVRQPELLARVRQGSEQAEFLLCSGCDTLVAACFIYEQTLYGVANARVLCARNAVGPAAVASPRKLDPAAKAERWRRIWFADVRIEPGETD